ncbi:MAG: MBL fold metallo-hydrolase [Oscillospiraceae bacterium]
MSRICPLASSSKGNSIFVSGGDTALLVDVGISAKAVRNAIEERGQKLSDLCGIVITHEHSDHIKGLRVLLSQLKVPVYSAMETLEHLAYRDLVPPDACLVPLEGTFVIGDIQVNAFDTPHDAIHSIGVRMELPDGRKAAIATDLGCITPAVEAGLTGCDLVMLESNYDPGMLSCSRYPYPLKRRIKGSFGHLSNTDCAEEIRRLVKAGTTRFLLGHLSEENNLPELAYETSKSAFDELRMVERCDYTLSVAPAGRPHEMVVF